MHEHWNRRTRDIDTMYTLAIQLDLPSFLIGAQIQYALPTFPATDIQ